MTERVEFFGYPPEGYFENLEPYTYCERCGEPLYEGQDAIKWEGYYFCDEYCFLRWIGAKEVGVGDED